MKLCCEKAQLWYRKRKTQKQNNKTAVNFAKNIFCVDQIIYCETGSSV